MFFKIAFGKEIHVMNPKDKTTLSQVKEFIRTVFKRLPPKYMLTYIDAESDQISLGNENDLIILHESGLKSVKLYIEETSEQFFDQTEEVMIEAQEDIIEVKIEEAILEEEKGAPIELNESSISNIENLDESIEEKLKKMLPNIVENIRSEILKENSIRSSKVEDTQPEIKEESKSGKVVHKNYICDDCGKDPIEGIRYKCAVCADFDLCQACEDKSTHDHPFLKIRHPGQNPVKIITILNDNQDSIELNGQKLQIPGLQNGIQMAHSFFQNMQARQPTEQAQQQHPGFMMAQQFFQNMQCGQSNQQQQQQPCSGENKKKESMKNFFKNMMGQCQQAKQEKKEEKKEEKVENIEKVEKVEVAEKNVEPVIVEEMKEEPKSEEYELSGEDKIIDSANYLADLLDINFQRCYKFSKKNPSLTKEQLLELYFSDHRKI